MDPHTDDTSPDITQALHQLEQIPSEGESASPSSEALPPADVAVLENPVQKHSGSCPVAKLKGGICKVSRAIVKSPLWAAVGMAASAGSWCVCEYFGYTVLAGFIAWALVEDV